VLRELTSLIEMSFRQMKAYLAVNLFFAIVFPVAMIFGFSYIVRGPAVYYFVSGVIVLQVSLSNILSVPQNIGWDRENGRLSLIISMGVPLWAYAIAMMLPNNLYAMGSGLLVLGVAVAMGYLSVSPGGLAMLVLALLVSSIQGSMVGLLMAARIRNWRLLQQVSSIAGFGFSFFAPVYFPLSVVPRYLLPLAMLEPTTYAAQAIRLSLLGDPASFVWDLGTAAYGAVMAALASKWGLKA